MSCPHCDGRTLFQQCIDRLTAEKALLRQQVIEYQKAFEDIERKMRSVKWDDVVRRGL
jgi:hypothetical protein